MYFWSPKRLDFHIIATVTAAQFLCLVVAALAMWLVLLALVASDFFQGTGASILEHLLTAAYQVPRLTVECLPVITIVGSALAYSYLSGKNELPIFRAAGISAWRFLAPAGIYGLLAGGFVIVSFWQFSGVADRMFVDLADRIRHQKLTPEITIWLHQRDPDQTVLVRGTRVTPFSDTLVGASFFVLRDAQDDGLLFEKRIDGSVASLEDGQWRIDSAVTRMVSGESQLSESTTLPSRLTTPVIHALGVAENQVTFWQYPRYIEARKLAGRSVSRYIYKFHFLLCLSVFLAGMAMLGGLLCSRLARFGDLAIRIALASGIGVAAMFMTAIAYAAADRNLLDPVLAAWCPALFFFFLSLALIATVEDG